MVQHDNYIPSLPMYLDCITFPVEFLGVVKKILVTFKSRDC